MIDESVWLGERHVVSTGGSDLYWFRDGRCSKLRNQMSWNPWRVRMMVIRSQSRARPFNPHLRNIRLVNGTLEQ